MSNADDPCHTAQALIARIALTGTIVLLTGAIALAQGGVEGLSPNAGRDDTIMAAGRLADTSAAVRRGYGIFNIGDSWTLEKNFAWVVAMSRQGLSVRTVSELKANELWNTTDGIPTVYARELAQLAALGYQRAGFWLIPPNASQSRRSGGFDSDIFKNLEQSIPDGVNPGEWLKERLSSAFASQPDAEEAWAGLRSDVWGAMGREQIEQIDDVITVIGGAAGSVAPGARPAVWSRGSMRSGKQDPVDASYGWRGERSSAAFGASGSAGAWQLALAFDTGAIDISASDVVALTAGAHTTHVAGAARAAVGGLSIAIMTAWGQMDWAGERHARIQSAGNPNSTSLGAAAETDGSAAAISAGMSWPVEMGALAIEPAISVRYAHSSVAAFAESGADELDLTVSPSDLDSTATTLGCGVAWRAWLSPSLHVSWRHDIGALEPSLSSTFVGGGGFEERTAAAGQDRLGVAAGVAVEPESAPHLALRFSYGFETARDYRSHSFLVAAGWKF